MDHPKSSACREWSPSLTNRIPETHISAPITSDVSGHTDEQNEIASQSSHKSQQAAEQNEVPSHLSDRADEAPSQSTQLGDQAGEARTYLRDLLTGHLMCYEPIKFKIPFVSWCKLTSDPEFQLITKGSALLMWYLIMY